MNKQAVLKAVSDNNVKFIRLWFTDVLGMLKSFAITVEELEEALDEGMGFDASSIEGFALEATGDPEKLDEFIDVMRSYGEIETTRSGVVAVSLESKKLKLQPPVLTEAR